MQQNDLPPICDWCARATFYRTLLSVQGIIAAAWPLKRDRTIGRELSELYKRYLTYILNVPSVLIYLL
jgi:hypothetical protein